MPEVRVGRVKLINHTRKFGFIESLDRIPSKDIFFRYSEWNSKQYLLPEIGLKCYFKESMYCGKPIAIDVIYYEEARWLTK